MGSALKQRLLQEDIDIVEVVNRNHVDLRDAEKFLNFIEPHTADISFVFFLACDVGGSKFLETHDQDIQLEIIENNIRIYQTVLPWLQNHSIPFLFTSSSLHSQESPYGVIKKLGEQWISNLGVGKSVRLWNVFGKEKIGHRSRVISDWIYQCLTKGTITSRTNGLEFRQFLYTKDCADALFLMMEMYDSLESVIDLSSNRWSQMQDVAFSITKLSPKPCTLSFSDSSAKLVKSENPDILSVFYAQTNWTPKYSLENALLELMDAYSHDVINCDIENFYDQSNCGSSCSK